MVIAMAAQSSGKWISGLTSATTLVEAAQNVLGVRLAAVVHYLGLALTAAREDPEHVHQLRVSTRRAVAALDIFAGCLPKHSYRSARKRLRDIRRAAGAARDWDVFLSELPESLPPRSARRAPGLNFLAGYALAERVRAQDLIEEAGADFPAALEHIVASTLHAVREPTTGPLELGDLAKVDLMALLDDLEEAAAKDLEDYAHLHQVRIVGKRLRYAMELFVDCYESAFRERLYPAIEEMQDILGRANDSYVAAQRLRDLSSELKALRPGQWKRFKPCIEHLRRFHERRLPKERRRFEAWWKQWQEAGTPEAFIELLKAQPQAARSRAESARAERATEEEVCP